MHLQGYVQLAFGEMEFNLSQFLDYSGKVDGFAKDILIFFVSPRNVNPALSALLRSALREGIAWKNNRELSG